MSKITIQTIIDSKNDRNLDSNPLITHRKNTTDIIFMASMMSNILSQYEEDLEKAMLLAFLTDVIENLGYRVKENAKQEACEPFTEVIKILKGRK